MIPYPAWLLDITIKNTTIPSDWKSVIVVPIYKGGSSIASHNCRPVTLTSVFCQQLEHVIVVCLRQVCDTSKWLDEG